MYLLAPTNKALQSPPYARKSLGLKPQSWRHKARAVVRTGLKEQCLSWRTSFCLWLSPSGLLLVTWDKKWQYVLCRSVYICVCVCVHPETGTFINKPQDTLQCWNTLQRVCGHLVLSLLLSLRYQVSLFTLCLIQDLEFLKSSKTLSCDPKLISRKSGRGSRKGHSSHSHWRRWSQCEVLEPFSVEPGMRSKGKSNARCRLSYMPHVFFPL